MAVFFTGFALGLSLIMAIGAQNAFILKQGLRREHVFILCLICAVSDALLIALGVSGFAVLMQSAPWIEPLARYGGAAFLFFYGLKSFWAAFKSSDAMALGGQVAVPLKTAVLTCLAFTWLNPHVYLDTMVLLGSIATQYPDGKWEFGLGAVSASIVFFFSLGYGARLLAPIFQRPAAWRVLDFVIGCVMWAIGASLVF